jgi:hypothetical protein
MDDRGVALMSGSELLSAYDTLHDEIAEREARQVQVLAQLDEIGHAKTIGAHDTARLLADRYRLDPAEATRRVKFAGALWKYPAVTAALPTPGTTIADGGVVMHLGQAQAIVSALEQIPKRAHVPADDLTAAEERMVEAARRLAPGDLRSLGVQIRNLLDTDGPEPREDAARADENIWVKKTDGGVTFGGRLAAENAELFEATLQFGAKPHKTVTGEPDPRPRGKRYADALVDALQIAAGSGELPARGGIKPHITITIDLDALIAAGKQATGDLMFGDGLSAAAIRRLACDAGIIPVVLGSDSQPLDVGREYRFVTNGLRNALIQRDRGCVVCGAPPIYCDAHHLVSWLDGGVTSLANSVLLCRVHHTALHNGHWTIEIIDHQVQVTRPTWAERPPRGRGRRLVPPSTTATAATATTGADTCPPTPTCPPRPAWPWPYTTDIGWITPEETAALNPWGDNTPDTDNPSTASPTTPTTSALNPWGDIAADTANPLTATPTTPNTAAIDPWGDNPADTGATDLPSVPVVSLFDPWADSA